MPVKPKLTAKYNRNIILDNSAIESISLDLILDVTRGKHLKQKTVPNPIMGRDSKNHTPTLDIEPILSCSIDVYRHVIKKKLNTPL